MLKLCGFEVPSVPTALSWALFLSACKTPLPTTSEAKISNGIEISASEYPEVFGLLIPRGAIGTKAKASCVGTFVAANALITAAHCFESINIGSLPADHGLSAIDWPLQIFNNQNAQLGIGDAQVIPAKVFLNPQFVTHEKWIYANFDDWSQQPWKKYNRFDVAIVVVPSAFGDGAGRKFVGARPVVGSEVTLVGFSWNRPAPESDSDGVDRAPDPSRTQRKRKGTNVIAEPEPASLEPYYGGFHRVVGLKADSSSVTAGTESSALPGDSGSPLFVGEEIAGVLRGDVPIDSPTDDHEGVQYVDITKSENKAFIDQALLQARTMHLEARAQDLNGTWADPVTGLKWRLGKGRAAPVMYPLPTDVPCLDGGKLPTVEQLKTALTNGLNRSNVNKSYGATLDELFGSLWVAANPPIEADGRPRVFTAMNPKTKALDVRAPDAFGYSKYYSHYLVCVR